MTALLFPHQIIHRINQITNTNYSATAIILNKSTYLSHYLQLILFRANLASLSAIENDAKLLFPATLRH